MLSEVLLRAELLVALIALGTALKSAYNGWIHQHVLAPLDKIEEVDDRTQRLEENQEEMTEQQENLVNGVIALGKSHENNAEFDVDSFKEETGRSSGVDDFLRGGRNDD